MAAKNNIRFLLNAKGKKTDVIIPIKQYMEIMEDLDDVKTVKKRRNEKTISLNEVKRKLGMRND